jgi:hypothetical protein
MKLSLKILLTLLLSTCCFAQGGHRLSQVIVRGNGIAANVVPFASVNVCVAGTFCHTLQPVFSDLLLTQPLIQPVVADAGGNFDYYVPSGCYDEQYSSPTLGTQTRYNVCTGGGVTSTCGPLAGDATSTNCGNGNFTGLAGNSSVNQAYGYFNIDGSSGIDLIVAAGNNNAQSVTNFNNLVAIGLSNGANLNAGNSVVAIGQSTGNGKSVGTVNPISTLNVVAIGTVAAGRIGNHTNDIVAIGDGAASQVAANSSDIVAIGDGADKQCQNLSGCGAFPTPVEVHDVVAIGDGAAGFSQGSNVQAIGNQTLGPNSVGSAIISNTGSFNSAMGSMALAANTTGSKNVAFGGFSGSDGWTNFAIGNSNQTGSNNTWIGYDSGPNTTTQLSNTIALGYQAANTASNQTVIGNSSITSLKIFGCPTGQSALDDGSGTCYVPGSSSFITSLTTTGSSGVATVSGGVLNIPVYSGGGGSGTVTSFAAPSGSWPTWLVPTVTNSTTAPSLAVASTLSLANVAAGASPTGLFDFSNATNLKLPIHAGYTAPAVGEIGYDSTNGNLHTNYVGTDLIIAGFPSASLPVSGHCAQFTEIGAWWEITDAGAACGSGSGGGNTTSTSLTTNTIPKANGANSIINSGITDDGTKMTYAGSGTANGMQIPEGTAISGVALSGVMYPATSTHRWMQNPNNIGALMIPGIATAGTAADCVKLAANGIDLVDAGSACGSGGGSGFPITLGSTSIAASSTTTAIAGLSVNGVTLNAAGSSTLFLNQAGGYTTAGGGTCGSGNIPCTNTANSFTTGLQAISTGSPTTVGQAISATSGSRSLAFVQSNGSVAAGGATNAVTFTSSVTVGNAIVVAIYGVTSGAATTYTVADTLGNAFASVSTPPHDPGGSNMNIQVACSSISAGADTVTVTAAAGIVSSVSILEYSGIAPTSCLDTQATLTNFVLPNPSTVGPITTGNDLIFTAAWNAQLSPASSAPGYTNRQVSSDSSNGLSMQTADKIVTAGSQSAAWTTGRGVALAIVGLLPDTSGLQTADLSQWKNSPGTVIAQVDANGGAHFPTYDTKTNCSSSASPAVCASASAGSVAVAASGTTLVVNTTTVTINSQIFLQEDSSLGTKLSVTCNTTPATAPPTVSARTAGTGFTFTTTTPTTNPRCFSYEVVN